MNYLWRLVASFLARPRVFMWLLLRAVANPYKHITGPDGNIYMRRYWLFRSSWLPSIRLHHIRRPDFGSHLHNHPWNARTLILSGGYTEERPFEITTERQAGDTAVIGRDTFHRVCAVEPGGAWTVVIIWPRRYGWGFRVDGRFVPSWAYLG